MIKVYEILKGMSRGKSQLFWLTWKRGRAYTFRMKITAKSRYALRILLDIALYDGKAPRTIGEISESQAISEKFISRIVVPLRRAGLVATERGVRGGLRLARFAELITLYDIVEAMEGPFGLLRCLVRPGVCPRQGKCAAECAWRRVNDAYADALKGVKLTDIVADQRRISAAGADGPEYCI